MLGDGSGEVLVQIGKYVYPIDLSDECDLDFPGSWEKQSQGYSRIECSVHPVGTPPSKYPTHPAKPHRLAGIPSSQCQMNQAFQECSTIPAVKQKQEYNIMPLVKQEQEYSTMSVTRQEQEYCTISVTRQEQEYSTMSVTRQEQGYSTMSVTKQEQGYSTMSVVKQEQGYSTTPVVKHEQENSITSGEHHTGDISIEQPDQHTAPESTYDSLQCGIIDMNSLDSCYQTVDAAFDECQNNPICPNTCTSCGFLEKHKLSLEMKNNCSSWISEYSENKSPCQSDKGNTTQTETLEGGVSSNSHAHGGGSRDLPIHVVEKGISVYNEYSQNQDIEKHNTDRVMDSQASTTSTPAHERRAKRRKKRCKIWEFIRNLLLDPATNPSLIVWENKEDGRFRLVQPRTIAYMWGMERGNSNMNYEKLSRAMRYHYKRNVLSPVMGKNLMYKFGPSATGWK